MTLKKPRQLLNSSPRTEISGQNVLEVERYVLAKKNFLILDSQASEKFLRECKFCDKHQDFAEVSDEVGLVQIFFFLNQI